MLEVDGLVVRYGGIHAVRGIDLCVGERQAVGVIGPNGAGKSSTLKAISGVVSPAAGTVRWNGRNISGRRPHELARDGIVLVPEGRGLFLSLTVAENLSTAAFARRREGSRLRAGIDEVLEMFPALRRRLDQATWSLSGGEQQMLAIGRALLMDPELLIVDELSLGLAPLVVREIYDTLHQKNLEGLSILLVEQHLPFVLGTTDLVYVLERGRVADRGSPKQIAASAELYQSYVGAAVR